MDYRKAKKYLGKQVTCHCRHGVHHGVVRKVNREGIWIERTQPGYRNVAGDNAMLDAVTADRPEGVQGEEVFFPLFFIPFLTLLALAPLAFRPYGYGGYGGYW